MMRDLKCTDCGCPLERIDYVRPEYRPQAWLDYKPRDPLCQKCNEEANRKLRESYGKETK